MARPASRCGGPRTTAPADSQVTPDLLASKAADFGRDSAGAATAELGYPPAARTLARREALANRTGKSPRTIARTQQGMPNVQHARLLVIPVEFNPNANDDFSGFERYDVVAERVRDPDGAAVQITFGWACSEDVSDCDLRTLTERADAALLRRKPARSR